MTHGFMQGLFCPVCGDDNLRRRPDGVLRCTNIGCSDTKAAHKILSDPEIHHVVRFDEHGYFNSQHPLRERIDGALLDCEIHEVVLRWVREREGSPHAALEQLANTVWRVRRAGEHNLDTNWIWEQLT